MAPNQTQVASNGYQHAPQKEEESKAEGKTDDYVYKTQIVLRNVIFFSYLHYGALYGLYYMFSGNIKLLTAVFTIIYAMGGGFGITAGAHRLWSHKSYKATLPLRIFLAYIQAAAFQNHIYEWVRDHRVHHKFCDTNADPYNSKRGFFFSHMGWLMVRKHRDVMEKGKSIDMSDLEQDKVVMFQKKYYGIIMPLACFILPTLIPWYFWGEDLSKSYWVCLGRYAWNLHATWLVNSAAHLWGDKPYDKNLSASNNKFVGIAAVGEGWHNYHHAFPWDYKASEHWNINATTKFINMFVKIGWAYDLKEASEDMIRKRALRTGDGSKVQVSLGKKRTERNKEEINPHEGELWGWDDKDMTQEERDLTLIKNKIE